MGLFPTSCEGEALASLHPQIVVKIPMILEGIKAIKYFA